MARLIFLVLVLPFAAERRCNIPVFRYALERWHPSPYEVVVFHKGPLDGEARATVDALRAENANVEVDHADLERDQSPKLRKLWESQKDATLPWMIALFPGNEMPAWAGPATAAAAKLLLDSPVRREISRRLLAGDSAIWLLLESGKKDADDAAAALVDSRLRGLEKSLKLPVHRPDDPPLLSELPMRIGFSTLRLSRQDPAEKAFVEMLTRADPKAEGPAIYPVFGRGRALSALSGDDLDAKTIDYAGGFIAGPCACEVKELNPGVDLLLTLDWEQLLALARAEPTPPVPEPVIAPGAPKPVETPPTSSRPVLWAALAVAGLLVFITGTRAFRRA